MKHLSLLTLVQDMSVCSAPPSPLTALWLCVVHSPSSVLPSHTKERKIGLQSGAVRPRVVLLALRLGLGYKLQEIVGQLGGEEGESEGSLGSRRNAMMKSHPCRSCSTFFLRRSSSNAEAISCASSSSSSMSVIRRRTLRKAGSLRNMADATPPLPEPANPNPTPASPPAPCVDPTASGNGAEPAQKNGTSTLRRIAGQGGAQTQGGAGQDAQGADHRRGGPSSLGSWARIRTSVRGTARPMTISRAAGSPFTTTASSGSCLTNRWWAPTRRTCLNASNWAPSA